MRIRPRTSRLLKRMLLLLAVFIIWKKTRTIQWMYGKLTEVYYFGKYQTICPNQGIQTESPQQKPEGFQFTPEREAEIEEIHHARYTAPLSLPLNTSDSVVYGRVFNMDESTERIARHILKTQTFKRKPIEIASVASLPKIVPVTGSSSGHFLESMIHISSVLLYFPETKVVYYDLGLHSSEIEQLKSLPFVEYRKFDFCRYPSHVLDLHNYAWKIFIIQEMLSEFDAAMWFDSSILFYRKLTTIFERIVRHKSGFLFYIWSVGHSVITATHPRMLEYFPSQRSSLLRDMNQSGGMIFFNTAEVQKHILKWAIMCALTVDCISPPDATLICDFKNTPRDRNVGCHRYDQSLLDVLASNAYNYKEEIYAAERKEVLGVIRRLG